MNRKKIMDKFFLLLVLDVHQHETSPVSIFLKTFSFKNSPGTPVCLIANRRFMNIF